MKWSRNAGIFLFRAAATLAMLLPLSAIMLPTGLVFAADATSGPIVSCNSPEGVGITSCTICAAVTLGQNIINFAIVVAMPIAAILFAYAGLLYMTSGINAAQITRAHTIFKSAAIGFIFVVAGWLIVDTLIHQVFLRNFDTYFESSGGTWFRVPACTGARATDKLVRDLLGGTFTAGTPDDSPIIPTGPSTFSCRAPSVPVGPAGCANLSTNEYTMPNGYSCPPASTFSGQTGGCTTTGGTTVSPTRTITLTEGTYTHDAAIEALMGLNADATSRLAYSPGVNFDRTSTVLISNIASQVQIANQGTVTITSANDRRHSDNSEHYSGTAVDVGGGSGNNRNANFDAYIRSNWTRVSGFGRETYRDPNGFVWNFETNHWHVSRSGR